MDADPNEDTRLTPKQRANLGALIKQIRESGNLKQGGLVARSGLSQGTISKLELGKYVSDDTIRRVANALAPHTERILDAADLPVLDIEPWDTHTVTSKSQGADRLAAIEATLTILTEQIAEIMADLAAMKAKQ